MKKKQTAKKQPVKSVKMNSEIPAYVKKLVEEGKRDTERYVGALAEDFQSKLSVVAELVLGTNDKVDGLSVKLDRLEGRMENMEGRMENMEGRMENMEGRMERVENTLVAHTEMIGSLMESMETVKVELKRKVDYDEFISLERRVLALEKERLSA